MSDFLKNSILDIINNFSDFFLNKNNINGIGLSYKITNGINTKEPCLSVFVEKKIHSNHLCNDQLISKNFLGIKTDVIQSPAPKISSFTSTTIPNINPINNKFIRPLQAGYSISPINTTGYGTIGAIINYENSAYILSTNHVLANTNLLNIGTSLVQPGKSSFLKEEDNFLQENKNTVAYLYKKVILKANANFYNIADCAIAKIFPNIPYTEEINNIGKIGFSASAKLGDEVKKVGATTGYTTGVVEATNSIYRLNYNIGQVLFKDIIICSKMSEEGDSGSVVLNSSNNPIGLLIGINHSQTFANSIIPIEKLLNIY